MRKKVTNNGQDLFAEVMTDSEKKVISDFLLHVLTQNNTPYKLKVDFIKDTLTKTITEDIARSKYGTTLDDAKYLQHCVASVSKYRKVINDKIDSMEYEQLKNTMGSNEELAKFLKELNKLEEIYNDKLE